MFKQLLYRLSQSEPLVANILMQIHKTPQSLSVPAALSSSKDGFELYYNPGILEKYDVEDQITILMHEVLHMINDHHLRGTNKKLNLWNVATDLAINCMLRYRISSLLKQELLLPEHFDLPDNKSADWYYTALQDYPTDIPVVFHIGWKLGLSGKNLLQQASFITGLSDIAIIEKTQRLSNKPSWKNILNKLIKFNLSDTKSYSYKKISRRFKKPPGKKRNYISPSILVVLDTSESISIKNLQTFAQEIYVLAIQNDCGLIIMECDEVVRRVYPFRPGQLINEVQGRQGTAYGPAFKEIEILTKHQNIGCVIYFTDGASPDGATLKRPQVPVVWAYPYARCPRAVAWGHHLDVCV